MRWTAARVNLISIVPVLAMTGGCTSIPFIAIHDVPANLRAELEDLEEAFEPKASSTFVAIDCLIYPQDPGACPRIAEDLASSLERLGIETADRMVWSPATATYIQLAIQRRSDAGAFIASSLVYAFSLGVIPFVSPVTYEVVAIRLEIDPERAGSAEETAALAVAKSQIDGLDGDGFRRGNLISLLETDGVIVIGSALAQHELRTWGSLLPTAWIGRGGRKRFFEDISVDREFESAAVASAASQAIRAVLWSPPLAANQ